MPEKLEHLRDMAEGGVLPLHHYVAARREWLSAELAAMERRLQCFVLNSFDSWEAEEYAKDLRRELNGELHGAD